MTEREIDIAAVKSTKCPTCGAEPERPCRNTKADDKGRHRPVPVHRKRVAAYLIW